MQTNNSKRKGAGPRAFARLSLLTLALALAAGAARAQSTTDGTTPSGIAPGSPAGSYALSGFEDVNLFNGNLNFNLPLLSVGGRGAARHTMTLAVDQRWSVETSVNDMTGAYTNLPEPFWWNGINPGYGPGVLQGRHGGDGSLRCGSSLTGFYNIFTKTLTRLTFTSSDGTEYELRDQQTGGQPQPKTCTNNATQYNRGRVFVTADGTSATFISDADITDRSRFAGQEGFVTAHSGYLLLRDGTRYRVDGGTVTWMRDRNGNLISFAYDANKRLTAINDSLGRQVTVAYDQAEGAPYGTCDRISYGGFGGTARVLRVCKTNLGSALRATRPYDVTTPQTPKALFPELSGSNSTPYDPAVVGSVWLPDGQRRYQLFYNQYAELSRVVLPTGGAIEYEHTGGYNGGNADGVVGTGTTRRAHIYRRVVERRVYPNGSDLNAVENRTTYSRPESMSTTYLGSVGYVTVEQFDGAGARRAYELHYFNGAAHPSFNGTPTQYSSWLDGREYKTEMFDAAGTTVLTRVEHTWQQRAPVSWWNTNYGPEPPNDPRLVTTVTTVEPAGSNLVSKQTAINPQTGAVGFDRYNNQTGLWEFDYGATPGAAGPAVRHTATDFVTTNTIDGITYDYACDPATTCGNAGINPNVVHLRGLMRDQYVYSVDPQTGAETPVARAHNDYDQTWLTDRPNITGLCTTYAGGQCSAANSTAYRTRGNLTAATKYRDAAAGSGPATTSTAYDIAGNVMAATDANGNTSQIGYADSFCNGTACGGGYVPGTYAFATSAASPVPDPTGQFGSTTSLVSSTVYDFYTGLTYSTTDANGKTTVLSYADALGNLDPLDRVKGVTRPDGSRTQFNYGDTPGGLYLQVLVDLDASRVLESRQYFDGLARGVRSFRRENQDAANPWLTVDTQYDWAGRAWRVSAQYRSAAPGFASNPPGPWTETTFDALGRVTQSKTTSDNAAVNSSYAGNTVTVTDQAGRGRKSVSDALGRTTAVYDDPAGQNLPTAYGYDALGNLRTVTQGGQTRTFVYDSLSRLTYASNPESGTVGYGYDANGNLLTRTDARGVVTNYGYDALNRNTTVRYSDAVLGAGNHTKDVDRHYDGAVNGRGRFYYFNWDPSNNTRFETHLAVDEYDPMGRPTKYRQHFLTNGTASPEFTVRRTYNLAGNVLMQTYPSGHAVSYSYDAAGRPGDYNGAAAFGGNLGDGVQRTYASEERYHPLGGREQERFGTDTPVYNKSLYNGRGQLAEIRVSTYSILSPGQETNWNRGAIINHYSTSGWGASGGGADNNGNLLRQEVYVPNDDQISGYLNVVQQYGYDALNRLSSVEDKPFNSTPNLSQSYSYDGRGNRTINAAGTSNAPAPQFDTGDLPNTNRLYAPGDTALPMGQRLMRYDAAGNLTHDAYTGAGARAYDAENRMTGAQDFYGQTSAYAYDADGRRVRRRVAGGAEVWQVYGMDSELLAEYAAGAPASAPQKEYGYRGGELLVQATSPVTSGAGLTAQYYDNMNLTGLKLTRTDASVNFDWGGGSPHPSVGADTFSVRWTGKVEPLYSQTYTFYTVSDDGVRLWVNGQLVIDKWIDQGPTEWSGQIALTAGQRYDIRVEFYENGGGATAKLLWSSPSQAKEAVPQARLYPATAGNQQADFEWVVADQLGTPRMILDKSGGLAGVKRHDYLPFGEEIPADANWRTPARGYVADNLRRQFTGQERDNEAGLDYFGARYYSSAQGRFSSPDPFSFQKEMLTDPQRFNLYAYARNNPLYYVDPTGMIIDTSHLSKDELEKWKKVLGVINAKDAKGNYVNPKLHDVYERLDSDKRTFFIENYSFGDRPGTVGEFNITKHNGKDDFSEAVLKLDFEQVEHLDRTTDADLAPGFKKYEGVIGETPEARAELFGHEGAHGVYALDHVAEAVRLQILKDERDAATKKTKYPYPPDLLKKMEEVDKRLVPTERFAQQTEQVINGELRAYLKSKKK